MASRVRAYRHALGGCQEHGMMLNFVVLDFGYDVSTSAGAQEAAHELQDLEGDRNAREPPALVVLRCK